MYNFFFKFCLKTLFIYFWREGKRRREGEKHQGMVTSHVPSTGDLACNIDMCPDWESIQRPLGSQAGAQSTELHQPGQDILETHSLYNNVHIVNNAVMYI